MSKLVDKRREARSAAAGAKPEPTKLDDQAKAARVLGSQGRVQAVVGSLSDEQVKKLAGCCEDSGTVAKGTAKVVDAVLAEYYESQKATVEKPPELGHADPMPTEKE